MIFAEGAQGASERAAIVGQVLRDGEYRVQRLLNKAQDSREWLFLAIHTTLGVSVVLKQVPADKPVAESILIQLDAILQAEDIIESADPPNSQEPEHTLPTFDGSATSLFAREALLLARLQYPTIPTLYDYFFERGYWYLVMDYIPAQTLTAYLQSHGPLSALEALHCALQICDTLDYLHTQTPAIVLRNLTPESIRVTPEGVLLLTNFDLAAYSQTEADEDEIDEAVEPAEAVTIHQHIHHPGDTETEMFAYIPAEQQAGAAQNKATSSDIYSLGVILDEMLYGKRTEQDRSSADLELDNALSISTYLKSLVRLATRAEPLDRFQSAQTFSLALQRAYQIEEQRAFREHLSLLQAQSVHAPEGREQGAGETAREEEIPRVSGQENVQREWREENVLSGTPFRELEQREFTRTAMQRIRRERLNQEQVELQLASVDEGLEQRSSMSHSQISLQAIARAEAPTAIIPTLQRFQRLIKVNFVLALLLCLVLVSLLIYIRVAQPIESTLHTLIQRPISSTKSSGNVQTIQSVQGAGKSEGVQNSQAPNGGLADSYWQALSSLPTAEADNAMAYVELQGREYIYMNGGYRGSPPPAYDHNLYRYDIRAAHWEMVGHFPGMVNNAATVDEQGHIFFTTGYSSDTYAVSSQLSIYDPGTASLKKVAPPIQMPLGFGGSILADRQGHLY
ncbi:MAG: protein kinase, partial [Ktedonobacteraceae bacterium]|nr:protein kinase [Ktedonobacteraceae bacterium]